MKYTLFNKKFIDHKHRYPTLGQRTHASGQVDNWINGNWIHVPNT